LDNKVIEFEFEFDILGMQALSLLLCFIVMLLFFPQTQFAKMSMLTVEECELLGDSKYRSYITQVEKALKSFESTSEWADLISALGKLNKVKLETALTDCGGGTWLSG
jgi:hypothetical protein